MKSVLGIKRVFPILGAAALFLLANATPVAVAQKAFNNQSAPEFVGTNWLNTPKNAPLTLASRKGKVTILHFWTFG